MTLPLFRDDGVKLCECGCGQPAPIAPYSAARSGWVRGQPLRRRRGHNKNWKVPHDVEQLRELYVNQGMSIAEVAKTIGVAHTTALQRLRAAGIPRRPAVTPRLTRPVHLYDRLFNRVEKTETCWLWTGPTRRGYGWIGIGGRRNRAVHRVAYELLVGPIPDGLTIDHLCRVRNCVNPEHLEPVTALENTRRGVEWRRAQRAR